MATESTLYTGFSAPTGIAMASALSQKNESSVEPSGIVGTDFPLDRNNESRFWFCWHGKDRTYQIRWRRRMRAKPTAEKAGGWSGWSAWMGADTCGTKTARSWAERTTPSNTQNPNTWKMANARPGNSGSLDTNQYKANQPVYMHCIEQVIQGNLFTRITATQYDAVQWQVQVRTWGEGNQMHGNHAEKTLTVYYKPTVFTVDSVKLNGSDGLRVYYTTNWNRDGNSVVVQWQDGSVSTIENVKGGINGTYFTIPSSKLDEDYDVGDMFHPRLVRFVTADNPRAYIEANPNMTVQALYPSSLAGTTLNVATDGNSHTATVTLHRNGSSYPWSSVTVWAGWYSPDGKWTTVSPSKVVSETNFDKGGDYDRTGVYRFSNVPCDVAVTFRAKIVTVDADDTPNEGTTLTVTEATSDSWGTDSRGRRGTILKSLGRTFLSIGDTTAFLRVSTDQGVTFNRSYAPDVETEKTAGRQRMISRHGIGGSASIQVKGNLIRESLPYDHDATGRLSDWEKMKLKTGSDGYLCMPEGFWAKVAVTGIDVDFEHPLYSVTLDLEEVV